MPQAAGYPVMREFSSRCQTRESEFSISQKLSFRHRIIRRVRERSRFRGTFPFRFERGLNEAEGEA